MRRIGRDGAKVVFGLTAVLAVCAMAVPLVRAEEFSVSATVRESRVTVGGEIVLSVVVAGSGLRSLPDPELPQIQRAAVYPAGKSTSISTSIVNGRLSTTRSVTHNYVIIPEQEGQLTIGSITVTHSGKTKRTAPITVTVAPAGKAYSGKAREPSREAAPRETGGKDVLVELVTDRQRAYVNEQLILTFRFYTRVGLLGQPEYVPPATTGFWVEPLPKQPSYETVVDGSTYLVLEVRSAVFPTRSGTLTIEPATLRCVIEEADPFFGRDPFDRFRRGVFGMLDRGREVRLRTDPVEVEVLPLPAEGVPASFGGAVGQYRMTMKADRTGVRQGEPVTLKISITGRGNVNTVSAPSIPEVAGMRSYDSGSHVNTEGSVGGLEGEKVYERVVVPEASGDFSIGPAEFSYFDPRLGEYRTLTAGPIQVSVSPGPVAIGPRPELPEKREIRLLSRDVRHICTGDLGLARREVPPYRSGWFLALQVVPLGAYLGALGYQRHRERLRQDVGYARLRRADRTARRRLTSARRHLAEPDGLAFCSALEKATREFVGDKFNLATVGMTYGELERSLQSRGIPYAIIAELVECLQACDRARFCPTDLHLEDRKALLARAQGVISRLGKAKA